MALSTQGLQALTCVLLPRGELGQLADQAGGLLVVGSQGEDAVVGGAGLLLAGGGGAVVVEHAGFAGQGEADGHFIIQHPP